MLCKAENYFKNMGLQEQDKRVRVTDGRPSGRLLCRQEEGRPGVGTAAEQATATQGVALTYQMATAQGSTRQKSGRPEKGKSSEERPRGAHENKRLELFPNLLFDLYLLKISTCRAKPQVIPKQLRLKIGGGDLLQERQWKRMGRAPGGADPAAHQHLGTQPPRVLNQWTLRRGWTTEVKVSLREESMSLVINNFI